MNKNNLRIGLRQHKLKIIIGLIRMKFGIKFGQKLKELISLGFN